MGLFVAGKGWALFVDYKNLDSEKVSCKVIIRLELFTFLIV